MDVVEVIIGFLIFSPVIYSLAANVWRRPEVISTPAWLAVAHALFLFGGPLVTVLFFGTVNDASRGQTLQIVVVSVLYFSTAAAVYFGLWGGVLRHLVGVRTSMSAIATLRQCVISAKPTEILVAGGVLVPIMTYLNVSYALNVSGGSDYFKMARLPYPIVVLNTLTMPLTLGLAAALAWLVTSRQQTYVKAVAVVLLLGVVGNTIAAGRRELLWLVGMVGLGVLWSGRKRLGIAAPFVFVSAYIVLFVFAPIFLRARLIYSSANSPGVAGAFQQAYKEQQTAVVDETSGTLTENMAWRFNTLKFWGQMYEERGPGSTQGLILLQGVTMSLPRALVGFWKYRHGAVDESILGTIDICNSIPLESYIDLGYLGPFVYGAIFGLGYALADFLLALTGLRFRAFAILSSSVLIRLLLGPEVNLISTFSDFRTILIYFLFASLIGIVFGRRPMSLLADAGNAGASSPVASGRMFAPAATPAIAGYATPPAPPRGAA